jgi:cobaltochelatase CobN
MVTALHGREDRGERRSGSQDTPAAATRDPGEDPEEGPAVPPVHRGSILLLSTSDTDLLAARASGADYRLANPARLDTADLAPLLADAGVVVARLLGGEQAWPEGLAALRRQPCPLIVLGGELVPDAALMTLSTVPAGIAAQAHEYLAHGGPGNLRQLAHFLADTVMMTGNGFAPPEPMPAWGLRPGPPGQAGPVVAVLYYRAHELAGNTGFVDALAAAIGGCGGRAMPVWCASLRSAEPGLLAALRQADVLVVTVLAAGGTVPAMSQAGGDDEAWDAGAIAALDIPVVQALCLTSSRAQWAAASGGLSPLDAATQVAIPEFDGRLISVPFSFKETGEDGLSRYVPDPERAARVAGTAVALARLRHVPPPDRRVAIVLSAYPTKHARIGNAVGLDTPASTVRLLRALRERGYDIGPARGPDALPGVEPPDGDALIHAVIAAGGQDPEWLTDQQLASAAVRIPAARYRRWFDRLPPELRAAVQSAWGPPPGDLYVDRAASADGEIVLAALRAGNVVLMVQPPRGFGENPVAIYHDPELPPSHHYLAAYRWLEEDFGAHAVVHLGKHGNLEWLPGKNLGMSAACGPDAALGNLPLIYPFLVNDPGEGTQAKRRAHATIVDHLVPPMTRAETYGDLARLEQLLDEHAAVASLDPAKLPAIRARIWTLIQAARLDHDLGLDSRPGDTEFDDFLLHVDGWLCEVKDAQIRDGLHVLGVAPEGAARVGLVLAILQARQIWAGAAAMPGLREALGLAEDGTASRSSVDRAEELARALVEGMELAGWQAGAAAAVTADVLGAGNETVERLLRFAAGELIPRLAGTAGEIDAILHALDGGHVPAGPSGSPLRGLVNTLPTGRNFYAVDPKAVPSRLAWETGQQLAGSLLARYREDTGQWPSTVGLSVWGTAAMRTAGDDIAEALALLGVRPAWDEASRRVTGLEVVPAAELGRPRIDVVMRISGFFRDAFPHVVTLLDDAVRLAAGLDEDPADNFVRAHVLADTERLGDLRRATTRIFGSPPGCYGAGLLPLMESRSWRDDADLAEVYAAWGGHAYGRGLDGRAAREDMESSYRRIRLAVKNTDSREHDIADSDDYYQYHGGMIATVRSLTGTAPLAYVGDSTRPGNVRTRSLMEESARVFRSRVVNPRWIQAMRRHGYKGAFELAATVDYLFGWDATTGVVADWMYEQLAASYVLDPQTRDFLQTSNPWALREITGRLLEAAGRGLWAEPSEPTMAALQQIYLQVEGQLEEAQA